MGFISSVPDSLVKLRGSRHIAPLHISFCKAKDVEFVLSKKGQEAMVLRVGREFRKAAKILETNPQRVVQFNIGREPPGIVHS